MFPSISRCSPGTTVVSSFIAKTTQTINIANNIILKINNNIVSTRPVNVAAGSKVSAEVIAPIEYLEHKIIPFSINGDDSSFAIVNKNEYIASLLTEAYQKRWWDYRPQNAHTITYQNSNNDNIDIDLGYNTQDLSLNLHTIIDPLSKSIYFYTENGLLIQNIKLLSAPQYIVKSFDGVSDYYLVSCEDGCLYKLVLDKTITRQICLENASVSPMTDWLFELPFETDIPFKGTFTAYAMYKIAVNSTLSAKCIAFADNKNWVGGYKKVWILDINFNTIFEFTNINGLVTGIIAKDNWAIITTKLGEVFKLSDNGDIEKLFSSKWISPPIIFDNSVVVSDSTNSRLVMFDIADNFSKSYLLTGEFAPSYLHADADKLYVCGHDANKILIYSSGLFTEQIFTKRITSISAVNGSLILSHYLDRIDVIDHSSQSSIYPLTIEPVISNLTLANIIPQKITIEYGRPITAIVPSTCTMWIDGVPGNLITDGCVMTVSTKVSSLSPIQYPIIIGDKAYDLLFTGVNQSLIPRSIDFPKLLVKDKYSQYDFVIPDDYIGLIPSIDYGFIQVNFKNYTGNTPLKSGDIISICIPFGNTVTDLIVLFTIGNSRIPIVVQQSDLTEHIITNDYRNVNTPESATFTITVPGYYYIPQYFSAPILEVSISKNTLPISWGVNYFDTGDIISIDIMSSAKIYDIKSGIIIGPELFIYKLKTSHYNNNIISYLDFGVLPNPYPRNTYTSDTKLISGLTNIDPVTNNPLPSSTVTLFSNDPSVTLSIDGLTYTPNITVSDGDSISINKLISGFNDPNISLYQEIIDPLFNTVVNVEVASWQITNQELPTYAAKYETPTHTINSYNINHNTHDVYSAPNFLKYAYSTTDKTSDVPLDIQLQTSYSQTTSWFFNIAKYTNNVFTSSDILGSVTYSSHDLLMSDRFICHYAPAQDLLFSQKFGALYTSNQFYDSLMMKFNHVEYNEWGLTGAFVIYHDDLTYVNGVVLPSFHNELSYKTSDVLPSFHNELSYKTSDVLLSNMAHYTDKYSTVFDKMILQLKYQIGDIFEYSHGLLSHNVSDRYNHSKDKTSTIDTDSTDVPVVEYTNINYIINSAFNIKVDKTNIRIVVVFDLYSNKQNIIVVDNYNYDADNIVIHNTLLTNKYGAFDSIQLTADSATSRNHLPFIVFKIPDTDLYTYRQLNDITRDCDIVSSTIYAIYGLIKGG